VPDYTQLKDIYQPHTNYVQSKFAKNLIEAIIKKAIEDKTFSERINHMPHVKKARTIMMQRGNTFRQRNILLEKHLSRGVQDTEEQYFGLKVAQVSGKAEP
jgi:hypothetical protein